MSGLVEREVCALGTRPRDGETVTLALADGLAAVEALLVGGVLQVRATNLSAGQLELALLVETGVRGRHGRAELAAGATSDPFPLRPDERVTVQLVRGAPDPGALTVSAWFVQPPDGAPTLVAQAVVPRA